MQLNPHFQKVKKAFPLALSCGHCKTVFATYQKVGKGNILKMYIDRIEYSTLDINPPSSLLECPSCHTNLGVLQVEKKTGKQFYVPKAGSVNKKKL